MPHASFLFPFLKYCVLFLPLNNYLGTLINLDIDYPMVLLSGPNYIHSKPPLIPVKIHYNVWSFLVTWERLVGGINLSEPVKFFVTLLVGI